MVTDPRRSFREVVALSLLAVVAACGSNTSGPSAIEGRYTLLELNETPLPYDHEGLGCCTYLSGTLELDAGRYAAALTARNRNTTQVFTALEWGSYVRRGAAVTFSPESVSVAGLLFDAGTLSGDTLRVLFGGEGHGSPDQFRALYLGSP